MRFYKYLSDSATSLTHVTDFGYQNSVFLILVQQIQFLFITGAWLVSCF